MAQQPIQYVQVQHSPTGVSVASLVLGIISFFLGFTFLVPLLGLILGIVGAAKQPAGRGMAVAGIILSALCLIGWIILVVLIFTVGMLGLGAAAAANATAGLALLGL